MKSGKQKILVISIIILILLIIGIIILLNKSKNRENEELPLPIEMPIISELEEETNYTEYFTVQSIINKIFEFSTNIDEMENDPINKEQMAHVQEYMEEYLEAVFYYYIGDNKISKDEFKEIYEQYCNEIYTINSMYVYNKTEDIKLIYVDGSLKNSKIHYPMVILHNEFNFTVLPYEYLQEICGKDNIIENLDKIQIESIENKGNNKFSYITVTGQDMALKYFNHYKKLILENTEEAYKLLDTEYKNKRFGDLNGFKRYVKENYETIKNAKMEKYKVEYYDDYTRYICIDKERTLLFL